MNNRSKSVLAALLLIGSTSAMRDRDYEYARGATTSDFMRTVESMERRHSEEMHTLREQQAYQVDYLTKILTETRSALDRSNRTIDELNAQIKKDRDTHAQEIKALQQKNEADTLRFQEERRHNMEMEKFEAEKVKRIRLLSDFFLMRHVQEGELIDKLKKSLDIN